MGNKMKYPTVETFLKDVKNHEIKILFDNGVYRHIKIKNPEHLNMYYKIVTFPGSLVLSGDMGTYIFERNSDMFAFFRRDDLTINPEYWSEKCTAQDISDPIEEFNPDKFRSNVEWYFNNHNDDLSEDEEKAVWKEIEAEILCRENAEWDLVAGLNNFYHSKFVFSDFWDMSYKSYTYRYVWCLYAIVHAVQLYDKGNQK